jgi:hypothetical protein
LKGPGGATIAKPNINIVANMAAYAVTTQKKILGADYGLSVIFPIVNTRFTANLFNASAESAGLSDIYFAPIVLGWEKGNLNYTVNYGFYAPTGSFDPSLALNPGLGYWEHQIQAGATYSIGKPKLWNTSFLTTWEINHSRSGDVKPGPMLTGEYSFGRRFDKYQMNAGIAGYGYKNFRRTRAVASIHCSPESLIGRSASARSGSTPISNGVWDSTSATSSSLRCRPRRQGALSS